MSSNSDSTELFKVSWMKYVIALEAVFRTLDDSSEIISELMESLVNIPEIKTALSTVETNIGAGVSLPKSTDAKYPGRPPKLPRLFSLKKDFSRPEFRKRMLLYGKRALTSTDSDRKDEKQQNKSYKETHIGIEESISTNLQLYIPKKRKLHVLNERNNNSYEIEDLYKSQKKRTNVTEKQYDTALHPSIVIENAKSVYNRVGDGHCGYRAISHIRYKEEENFRQVKADMLVAFEKNKNIYKNIFVYNVDELEKNIRACLDDSSPRVPEWFIVPDCAQVVADTYDVSVCVYPHSPRDLPLTFLPVRSPTKLKIKCRPYVLQNKSNSHWLAVNFNHLQTQFPTIQRFYLIYFSKHGTIMVSFPKLSPKNRNRQKKKKRKKAIEID